MCFAFPIVASAQTNFMFYLHGFPSFGDLDLRVKCQLRLAGSFFACASLALAHYAFPPFCVGRVTSGSQSVCFRAFSFADLVSLAAMFELYAGIFRLRFQLLPRFSHCFWNMSSAEAALASALLAMIEDRG